MSYGVCGLRCWVGHRNLLLKSLAHHLARFGRLNVLIAGFRRHIWRNVLFLRYEKAFFAFNGLSLAFYRGTRNGLVDILKLVRDRFGSFANDR